MFVLNNYDFGERELAAATVDKLMNAANLSEMDREILYLLYVEDWRRQDIAKYIGEKYEGRTPDNPLSEGTIRYRVKGILESLRQAYAALTQRCAE